MTTYYLDFAGGNDANDGLSFANRVQSVAAAAIANNLSPGDTVRMMASIKSSLAGCTLTNGSDILTVPAGNHQLLADCEATAGWTASPNVTLATSTTRMAGSNSVQLTVASAFTTGLVAYFDLGAPTDLSAFSAIALQLQCSTSALDTVTITLCSDAAATVVVDTFTWNLGNRSNDWNNIVAWNGGALGAAIRTIGISVSQDLGGYSMRLDCIGACHDPNVTPAAITPLSVLAITDTFADLFQDHTHESVPFYADCILSNTTLKISRGDQNAGAGTDWPFASLSPGTLYIWHPANQQTARDLLEKYGTPASPILFSGGWNRTDMSTQDADGLTVITNGEQVFDYMIQSGFRRLTYWNCERGVSILNDFIEGGEEQRALSECAQLAGRHYLLGKYENCCLFSLDTDERTSAYVSTMKIWACNNIRLTRLSLHRNIGCYDTVGFEYDRDRLSIHMLMGHSMANIYDRYGAGSLFSGTIIPTACVDTDRALFGGSGVVDNVVGGADTVIDTEDVNATSQTAISITGKCIEYSATVRYRPPRFHFVLNLPGLTPGEVTIETQMRCDTDSTSGGTVQLFLVIDFFGDNGYNFQQEVELDEAADTWKTLSYTFTAPTRGTVFLSVKPSSRDSSSRNIKYYLDDTTITDQARTYTVDWDNYIFGAPMVYSPEAGAFEEYHWANPWPILQPEQLLSDVTQDQEMDALLGRQGFSPLGANWTQDQEFAGAVTDAGGTGDDVTTFTLPAGAVGDCGGFKSWSTKSPIDLDISPWVDDIDLWLRNASGVFGYGISPIGIDLQRVHFEKDKREMFQFLVNYRDSETLPGMRLRARLFEADDNATLETNVASFFTGLTSIGIPWKVFDVSPNRNIYRTRQRILIIYQESELTEEITEGFERWSKRVYVARISEVIDAWGTGNAVLTNHDGTRTKTVEVSNRSPLQVQPNDEGYVLFDVLECRCNFYPNAVPIVGLSYGLDTEGDDHIITEGQDFITTE